METVFFGPEEDFEDLNAERRELSRLMCVSGEGGDMPSRRIVRGSVTEDGNAQSGKFAVGSLPTVIYGASNFGFQVLSWNNSVDVAMFKQEFACLEAFGQFNPDGRFDRPGPGETN